MFCRRFLVTNIARPKSSQFVAPPFLRQNVAHPSSGSFCCCLPLAAERNSAIDSIGDRIEIATVSAVEGRGIAQRSNCLECFPYL